MKKAPSPSPRPRPKPSSGSGSSSSRNANSNGGEEDRPLDMRSLKDTLPEASAGRRKSCPSPTIPSRRASLDHHGSPSTPPRSRRSSYDQPASRKLSISPRISVSKQPTVSSTRKESGSRLRKLSTRKSDDGRIRNGNEAEANLAASLPLDSLGLCLEKLQSVYHIVACASVCRQWREAVRSDVVWKALYVRWWHPGEETGIAAQTVRLPPGIGTWREAFISKYSEGKRKIRSEVITHGVNAGWLHVRRCLDLGGEPVKDCMSGDAMRKIVEQLELTFHVQINRDPPIRLRGKASVVHFPASCLLRYPTKTMKGGLTLRSLKSLKVTVTSDRLLRTCLVASFDASVDGPWETLSRPAPHAGLLRLLQPLAVKPSLSWVVGTLVDGRDEGGGGGGEEEAGEEKEPVVLVLASLHWSDLLWKLVQLGGGDTPQAARRWSHDLMNPSYGLHNWRASIQLHTFGKLLWGREFHQVFCSPRESTPGQSAVLLISSYEVFPGVLTSPWQTEVFSGELQGVFMLDFTLWDSGMEIAWHCTRAIRTYPAELATVEYGPHVLDGERVHTGVQDEHQGVSVSMNLCTPFADGWGAAQDLENTVVITDLRVALTPKFLVSWFGRSNL